MSQAAPPSAAELTQVFNNLLANPATGDVPDDSGLDDQTAAAIERVWAAGPNPPPALVDAARQELGLQLDGTHAAEAAQYQAAIFDQVAAEHEEPAGSVDQRAGQ